MSSELRIDMGELHEIWSDLLRVSATFDGIDAVSGRIEGAVGHHGLEKRVHEFSHGWDLRRKRITETLDVLWRAMQVIENTFETVDHDLAEAAGARAADG